MKTVTNGYKNNVKMFGREIDSKITYTLDNEEIELGATELNSVSPHYEGGILKSVMKQLDIDSNVDIPLGTVINYQFGVKVGNNYEYIDYGNYIVYSSEKQEDVNSYKLVCYDKMLYAMKDYHSLDMSFPITVRTFIEALAVEIDLTFKNSFDEFPNYDKEIAEELYIGTDGNSIGYTFRDVLDELAEVTASTICINELDDELELRYINNTNETIDEKSLKDVNVNFKEKFGPVNSIVLSRAGGADNVYLQDEDSIEENGLCEIKIEDNQIMNGNDRADYLPDILEQLDGLEYYANDFSSTGITFLELCDMYNVQIGENTYNCIMFNDEPNITQGLEELIYTDIPEETETEYKHASKDDRKINQTYIIAKKAEGEIEALASSIQDLTDYIKTVEDDGEIELENTADSDGAIWRLEITNLSELALYPKMSYPSETNYPGTMTSYIIVTRNEDGTKTNESYFDLSFPLISTDKLIVENNKISVKRVGADLQTNQTVILKTFDPKTYISIKGFDNAHFKCQYIEQNDFTKYFATQTEMQSQIQITDDVITSKVSKAELISEINQSAEKISMTSNRIEIDSEYFKLSEDGKITSTGGTIGGYKISDTMLYAETFAKTGYTQIDLEKLYGYLQGTVSLTDEEIELYDANNDGLLNYSDYVLMYHFIKNGVTNTDSAKIIMRTGTSVMDNSYIIQDGYGTKKVNLGVASSSFNQPLYLNIDNNDVSLNNLVNYKEPTEDNKPIGIWVDGKPIYRHVITDIFGSGTNSVSVADLNIDTMVDYNAMSYRMGSSNADYEKPYYASSNDYFRVFYRKNTNTMEIRIAGSYVSYETKIIIEYTKTTD